jgi:hypothetical protein
LGSSTELFCLDSVPDNWVKIHDILSNFYGLGDDGILRAAGTNQDGSMGLGTSYEGSYHIVDLKQPEFFGPGVRVIDFWATDVVYLTNWRVSTVWVQVDDNGTLRLYSFGYNDQGQVGNDTLATDAFTPFEHTSMINKPIRVIRNAIGAGVSHTFVITEDGEAWATGWNFNGFLSSGNTSDITTLTRCMFDAATPVTGAVDIRSFIAIGSYSASYLLRDDGTVWACGANADNILGIGTGFSSPIRYYTPVLTAPNKPLTGIVKIKVSALGLAALDDQGNVWITGKNNDGYWGNGQSAAAQNTAFATVKQSGIKDMWFSRAANGYQAAWWLKTDNTLWASGGDHYNQLGVMKNNVVYLLDALQVALPYGEYPVQLRWIGGSQDNGTDKVLLGGGVLMVTNNNKLYTWGRPLTAVHGVKGLIAARFPHCVNDFYDVRFI